jgi:hypothetical protein
MDALGAIPMLGVMKDAEIGIPLGRRLAPEAASDLSRIAPKASEDLVLRLKYNSKWSASERAAADAKVKALNDAGDLVKTNVKRAVPDRLGRLRILKKFRGSLAVPMTSITSLTCNWAAQTRWRT